MSTKPPIILDRNRCVIKTLIPDLNVTPIVIMMQEIMYAQAPINEFFPITNDFRYILGWSHVYFIRVKCIEC